MSRRMSCSLTIDAVNDRTKTVTRRAAWTWKTLRSGDRLTLVERQVVLAEVEVTSSTVVRLSDITRTECIAEGFPGLTPDQFIAMWVAAHNVRSYSATYVVRRIEWRYPDLPINESGRIETMTEGIIRPGPERIPPGQCPGGLVIQHYSVPADRAPGAVLIASVAVRDDPEVDALATAEFVNARTDLDVCMVIFDGDTGERLPPPPGYVAGDQFP